MILLVLPERFLCSSVIIYKELAAFYLSLPRVRSATREAEEPIYSHEFSYQTSTLLFVAAREPEVKYPCHSAFRESRCHGFTIHHPPSQTQTQLDLLR